MKKMKSILSILLTTLMIFPSVATSANEINNINNGIIVLSNENTVEKTSNEIIDYDNEKIEEIEKVAIDEKIKVEDQNKEDKITEEILVNEEEKNKEDKVTEKIVVNQDEKNKEENNEQITYEVNEEDIVGEKYNKVEKPALYELKENYEREEFNLKSQEIEEITLLENKTKENYEVEWLIVMEALHLLKLKILWRKL